MTTSSINPSISTTLGEHVAHTIAEHLNRLDWDYDDLAAATGGELSWAELVSYRGDARDMDVLQLQIIAAALGVSAHQLVKGWRA